MAITLEGVRVAQVSMDTNDKDGLNITGGYKLMSSTGVVVAKQGFNGYNDITITMSPETLALAHQFRNSLAKDITKVLGLE